MTNRLFIALEIPSEILDEIIIIRDEFYDEPVKWEKRDKLHITLNFLGDVSETNTEKVIKTLQSVMSNKYRFELQFLRFGLFYRNDNPSILWVGLNHSNELLKIYNEINVELEKIGFQKEKRKFNPHLTLLRLRGRENIDKVINLSKVEIEEGNFTASNISLFKSKLLPGGSVYEKVESFELK
ncbi:MAG: RNA 2',3'-cyclic phosphodiesterase [Melioribacteraceae bacterium]|nr:RNA 2',3'-cyclic phosphodiesterase [Melioribacteraceae bacterium]